MVVDLDLHIWDTDFKYFYTYDFIMFIEKKTSLKILVNQIHQMLEAGV
jgi:hypothetical protein